MHEIELRVRYAECDMQGHVFNGHYLTWFDMAHTEALRATVGDYAGLVARGIDVVVGEANLRFRRPARFDDVLTIAVGFDPPGTTSLTSDFTVTRGEDLIAEGRMRHVCVDATTFEKSPWPDWFKAALSTG